MASDFETLQGLWQVVSITSKGNPVGHGFTHYEFDSNRVKQIVPSFVEGGEWAIFEMDPTTTPKRLDITYEQISPEGEVMRCTIKHCYDLNSDEMRIGSTTFYGSYPEAIADTISSVTTLKRYHGPRPATKQPSGKVPVENAVLGTLTWNNNFDKWEGPLELLPGLKVRVTISPEDDDAEAIAVGQALVEWLQTHEADARAYAAGEMTELAEDWRDEEEEPDEITEQIFTARITLATISIKADGSANLWYDDDNLFAGHVVVISLNADREFTDAQMMG